MAEKTKLEDYPYPLEVKSSCLYNFKVYNTDIFDDSGEVKDLSKLKERLVTTIKKPITSEETDKGMKQQMISKIRIFAVFHKDLVFGSFKKLAAEGFSKKRKASVVEYALVKSGVGSVIKGKPILSKNQESELFSHLIEEIKQAGPFDDLGDFGKAVEDIVAASPEEELQELGKAINKNVKRNKT